MTEDAKTFRRRKTVFSSDKPWWQSKKFWIWLISFNTFAALLGCGMDTGVSEAVLVSMVVSMGGVSGIGLLGQAFVDSSVRFARAWRGLDCTETVWTEQEPEK